ncbi:outer membrane assembly protein BamC [Pseudoalteromonas phenolica]|uniref:Outer membrane assembly protein BamC n=1 Tax=Pseudoalteromonas phenolica TaxID=161398 RepID=A0A5S3YNP3_9GAMM|nr:outer membrane protein assembly factor BamC [Pseudoalteromonas phenolica]TMN86720.1 outer membrane assembly protein BamC [Pseudoalteromonas phenolica]TMP77976.1 outer membrane assembly protein BamC [Pseudoalteromonas phenolica]
MQYWIPKAVALGVVLGLSGCSVFTNDTHHERNYRINKAVQVPGDLKQPYKDPTYEMSEAQYNNDLEALALRPPQQVLTLATGSWVEQKDKIARVFFDKNDGIEDLQDFIWQAVEGVAQDEQFTFAQKNKSEGVAVTDWYSVIEPSSKWFWQEETTPSTQKYKFTVSQSEHQRTASLQAELVDYRSDDIELTDLLKQQLEVRALNQVIAEFDFKYRILLVELRKQQGELALDVGFDPQGNAAMVAPQSANLVLVNLSNVLERLNFIVIKVDSEENELHVRYEKPEDSVWDSIWGDEVVALPIEDGDYKIKISSLGDRQSSVTWRDNNADLLSAEQLAQLQQSLAKAIGNKGLSI